MLAPAAAAAPEPSQQLPTDKQMFNAIVNELLGKVTFKSRGQRQAAPRFQQVVDVAQPRLRRRSWKEHAVRVAQLEAAVQLLDVEDPALPPLREALMKARAQASAPPLTDQNASSELYVARKKKRLEEAEQGILEAVRKSDVLKAEVVAGEERLARLKDDLEMSRSSTVPGVSTPSTDLQTEVQKLRVVAELTPERDLFKAEAEELARKKFVTGTQHMASLPCPTLSSRGNCTSGLWPDRNTVVELTKLVHDGATQMKELMTPVPACESSWRSLPPRPQAQAAPSCCRVQWRQSKRFGAHTVG